MSEYDRLLILSCSRRKKPGVKQIPALERYNGPAFQVLRKFKRESLQSTSSPNVHILSARYGLIHANQPIPDYDREMTEERAAKLQPKVIAKLKAIIAGRSYDEIFIHAGRTYLQALNGFREAIQFETKVTIASGPPGQRLAEMRNWLYADSSTTVSSQYEIETNGVVYFKGANISFTSEQVLNIAREALAEDKGQPNSYFSWYVLIDGVKVAPKWLVSQLTGQSASTFNTGQARRVLAQLGIEVIAV